MTNKRLKLWGLGINYALELKTRAEALDIITDEREKIGKSPNKKEADAFFDAVRDIANTKATTKEKNGKIWEISGQYARKI